MEILSNFCGLLRKRQLRQLKRLFSGLFDLNTLIIEFTTMEKKQDIFLGLIFSDERITKKKSGFVNSGFVLAADEHEKTTYFHH